MVGSENISCTTEIRTTKPLGNNGELQQGYTAGFSALHIPTYKPFHQTVYRPSAFHVSNGELHNNLMFSQLDMSGSSTEGIIDASSLLSSPPIIANVSKDSMSTDFRGKQQEYSGFSIGLPLDMQGNGGVVESEQGTTKNSDSILDYNHLPMCFPFSLPPNVTDPLDSPQCLSETSTTCSTDNATLESTA
ncbi:Detected protein of unknown function [Hibiscus syriacus]|uniref:Uncharacterized protein n=1 Tax=Hibiscus syriacus TaxID=106335 RepID=A0A6A2XA97_HIBSY|nr:Detected protein of unknown function [Hibiscus syriacus]KAE8672517.1 Detected protein of unknown function [Hibiscus syriacus]